MTTTMIQDSLETFATLSSLPAGSRTQLRCRRDGYMSILPFGPDLSFAHTFFYEHPEGPVIGSLLLTPDRIRELAVEGLPLNHLKPGFAAGEEGPGTLAGPEDVLKAVQEEVAKDPKEERPDETDPEAIQSPTESDVFKRMNSEKLVQETLKNIFGDNGVKIKPGSLIDGTYLDEQKARPLRETIFVVNREGRPILQSYFNVFYDKDQLPSLVISRTAELIELEFFRKVTVEQTLKSSSFAAGLTLGLDSPTGQVSSGPAPGDKVHSKGQVLTGSNGSSFGFNAGFTKSYARLRIEAELRVQEKIGKLITSIHRVPPAGG